VAAHLSTAQFIASKLCIRFINDEPPAGAVEAIAGAFTASKGDIKTTLRALFATPEFRASAGTKFKRPFHFLVSALRATNAETNADRGLVSYLERMGHVPFRYPTPDSAPARALALARDAAWRQFAIALANNHIRRASTATPSILGGDLPPWPLLNRQPTADESDAYLNRATAWRSLLPLARLQRC
jgi:uncharacterized protein (DUF1800 family)